jgi:hypothetical protein
MKKFKEFLDSIFDVKSYGYIVNKKITRFALGLIILLALIVVKVDGWSVLVYGSVYYECEGPDDCINPFLPMKCDSIVVGDMYNNFVDCETNFVPSGWSHGVKPSWLAQKFGFFSAVIFCSALGLNHYLYNRKGVKK